MRVNEFQNASHINARKTRYTRVENVKTVTFNEIVTVSDPKKTEFLHILYLWAFDS